MSGISQCTWDCGILMPQCHIKYINFTIIQQYFKASSLFQHEPHFEIFNLVTFEATISSLQIHKHIVLSSLYYHTENHLSSSTFKYFCKPFSFGVIGYIYSNLSQILFSLLLKYLFILNLVHLWKYVHTGTSECAHII